MILTAKLTVQEKISIAEQLKVIKLDDINDFKPAVKVQEVIGSALPRIGAYKKLDNKKQVVALIDDVRFRMFL